MRLARSSATAGPTARTMQKRATSQWDIVVLPLRTKQSNVQAFIRRAPRMADKTSWTKPLAPMTYGDSIVIGARSAGQTRAGSYYFATLVAQDQRNALRTLLDYARDPFLTS